MFYTSYICIIGGTTNIMCLDCKPQWRLLQDTDIAGCSDNFCFSVYMRRQVDPMKITYSVRELNKGGVEEEK